MRVRMAVTGSGVLLMAVMAGLLTSWPVAGLVVGVVLTLAGLYSEGAE